MGALGAAETAATIRESQQRLEQLGELVASSQHDLKRVDAAVARIEALLNGRQPDEVGADPAAGFDAVRRRLEDTQLLVARIRDDLAGNVERVERARQRPEYDAAWDDECPLITVRIPTFQRARLLVERTLPTLLLQTYPHWECIVVGDVVTDDTAQRIAALGDERIRFENLAVRGPYPESPERRWRIAGTAPANAAAEASRGAWIAPLDDDDEFDNDHLEVLLERARSARAEFVYGQLRVRDAVTGEPIDNLVGRWPPEYGHIGLQGAMYHAAFMREGIQLDVHAWLAGEPSDWNLVRRLWEAGARFAFVNRPITTYYYAGPQ